MSDSLDHLFEGDTGPIGEPKSYAPARPVPVYKSAVERFEEGCPKCGGSGRFISYAGRDVGECFACKGAGKRSYKTSAETRANAREVAAERKADMKAGFVELWKQSNPAEFAWLEKTAARWDVAASLLAGLQQYGSLTEKQMALVQRGIERDAQRAAKPADAPSVDSAGIDRLKASFDAAVAYSAAKGLKLSPRITIDSMTISPAKANSANPGALYVKSGQTYLGKIAAGRFHASRDCTPADTAKVQAFVADPQEAAKVYGQTTGTCCICNATLRSEWKHKGIGPICAEKFGWA